MPEERQLYAIVKEGETSEAIPLPTVTSSATARGVQFSIQFPAPAGVPIRPEMEEPRAGA